jgi:uncharacterized repeat protein (TIGR01451 family)
MRFRGLFVLLTFITLTGIGILVMSARLMPAVAQDTPQCTTFVREALDNVGANCDGLGRNTACYGFNSLQAFFTQVVPDEFFTSPRDQGELPIFERIETAPLDLENDLWGIALMSVQANLPETLPGQSVIFMLVGDTEVESGVEPNAVFRTGPLTPITTTLPANLYRTPDLDGDTVGSVPPGTALEADATTEDGQWVRVTYNGIPGWLARTTIDMPTDTVLPVFTDQSRTAMQAFYFRTGIGSLECLTAPDVLIVQGPENLTIDLTGNGAAMEIGSTIVLSTLPIDPRSLALLFPNYFGTTRVAGLMVIRVLDGRAVIFPGTPNEIVIEEGEVGVTCLTESLDLGIDALENDNAIIDECGWVVRDMTEMDIAPLRELEGFVLNYPIRLPDLPDPTPTRIPGGAGSRGARPTLTPTNTPTPTLNAGGGGAPPPTGPTLTPTVPSGCTPVDFNIPNGDVTALIAAINAAGDEACYPGQNIVYLPTSGSFTLTAADNTTFGATGLPVIASEVIIEGRGATIAVDPLATPLRHFAVDAGGDLSLNQMTLTGGVAPSPGGAIYNVGGSVTLTNATLSGNSSTTDDGSAIHNSGTLNVTNSTISGNSGTAVVNQASGNATFTFVTFANNDIVGAEAPDHILNLSTVTLRASLFAGSLSNCEGGTFIAGTDTVTAGNACGGSLQVPSALIDPLANNGGGSLTHMLQTLSPAREAVANCLGISSDQRGQPRPQGPRCDAGAVEAPYIPPPEADLSLTKFVNQLYPSAGDTVEFTIIVSNAGPNDANNVVVRDLLPPELTYISHTASVGTYNQTTGQWLIGTVLPAIFEPPIYELAIHARVTAQPLGTAITNTAAIESFFATDPNLADNVDSESVFVSEVDIQVSKSADDLTPPEGGVVTFTITAANVSAYNASEVVIIDALEAGLTYDSHTASSGTFDPGQNEWTLTELLAGQSATLTLVADIDPGTAGDLIDNTAELESSFTNDTNSANDSQTITLTISTSNVDIEVIKSAGAASVAELAVVEFTITATNVGTDPATSVVIRDEIIGGFSYEYSSATQGIYDPLTELWTVGSLAPSQSATLTLAMSPGAGLAVDFYTNTASLESLDQIDVNSSNDSDGATVEVVLPQANMSIVKNVSDTTPDENDSITFQVQVSNNGPQTVSNVSVVDNIASEFTYVSSTADQGSYSPITDIWTIGAMAPDALVTLEITVTVNAGTGGTTTGNTAFINTPFSWNEISPGDETEFVEVMINSSCGSIPDPISTEAQLIDAINKANDETCFPGANTLNLASSVTINIAAQIPNITSTITINGGGATINAAGTGYRAFQVNSGATLTLDSLTITGGDGVAQGGAILTNGTLNADSVVFSGNSATSGGAVYVNSGTVTMTNTTFSGNSAGDQGGAAYNAGTFTVTNTTFSSNTASGSGGAAYNAGTLSGTNLLFTSNTAVLSGGAIFSNNSLTLNGGQIDNNDATDGASEGGGIYASATLNVSGVTISLNTAQSGGGLYTTTSSGTIANSTITGNSAFSDGGGLYSNGSNLVISGSTFNNNSAGSGGAIWNDNTIALVNSTISGNSATSVGAALFHNGGTSRLSFVTIAFNNSGEGPSVVNGTGMATLNIKNSIISNNTLGNCGGIITALGFNLTESSCGSFTVGTPDLQPLANNGGSTRTHALGASSAARDAVTDCTDVGSVSVSADQRGTARPQGSQCDAGAYEG